MQQKRKHIFSPKCDKYFKKGTTTRSCAKINLLIYSEHNFRSHIKMYRRREKKWKTTVSYDKHIELYDHVCIDTYIFLV